MEAITHLEAVRKGQRSHFPLLGFHWLLEPLALQAKAHLNENISYWLLEWLARAKQLINATWLQKAFRTASKFNFADLNVPYLYLLVIATHFPFSAITNIKLISIAFDVVLAGFTYLIVREKYGQTFVPFLAVCIDAIPNFV
jgi:Gpi18-like mannosyltransferase